MNVPRVEELALLPEEEAVQRHFDGRNDLVWRLLVVAVLAPASLVLMVIFLSEGLVARGVAAGAHLAALGALWLLRGNALFRCHFRVVLVAFLLAELAFMVALGKQELNVAVAFVLVPATLLFLRLRGREYLLLAAASAAVGIAPLLWEQRGAPVTQLVAQGIGLALAPAVVLVVALLLAQRERRQFLGRWREVATRERDRLRMRDELADARRIQLAMLPETAPRLDWLELSGSSLPATEVGGDFYDYLDLGDGRVAVVVGDVAGHGVSSGLVLAAVKGGLHLLRDELCHDPAAVFPRLDVMVREVVRWRVIVTLLVAVLDPEQRRLTVVAAGHPPLLLVPAEGAPRTVGHGAVPLGTRLASGFRPDTAPLAPGDVMLFYTDGASELDGHDGDPFGEERLLSALSGACGAGAPARQVREAVLDTLSRHKRDAPQRDDITLVVARVGELAAAAARR